MFLRLSRRRQKTELRLRRVLSNLAAWQIASALAVLGILLMWISGLSAAPPPKGATAFETTVKEVGALLLVTGALTVFWELRGRRALTDEVMTAANLSSEVSSAGLRGITDRYLPDVEWETYMATASHTDLFFAYARTWRNTHANALRSFVTRDGTRLRAILPDPQHQPLIERLADKFGYTAGQLVEHIKDAASDFQNLERQSAEMSDVEVRYTREFPVYTYYRFDRLCVVALYAQARGRTSVPTFVCEQGGSLNRFFRDQFDALWNAARALNPDGGPA